MRIARRKFVRIALVLATGLLFYKSVLQNISIAVSWRIDDNVDVTRYEKVWRKEDNVNVTRAEKNTIAIDDRSRDDIEWYAGKHPNVQVVNCARLFAGDEQEFHKAEGYHRMNEKVVLPDATFIGVDADCDAFRTRRGYVTSHMTEEERTFPIAFSIMTFKHVEQTERLLRAIYRPQNFYCIHVDSKSPNSVYGAVWSIANCFTNVFVVGKRADVQWGMYSVLEADLFCMEELLRYKTWRYFINLTSMEFPLQTNGDLVKILKAYNGANDVQGITREAQTAYVRERYDKKVARQSPPYHIVPVKGSVHVTLSRAFVEFMFHNEAALQFREWVKDTEIPDELYISSLNYNHQLKAPGAYLGDPDTLRPDFLNRYKLWMFDPRIIRKCHGIERHSICVFGVRNLPDFAHQKPLFANKFLLDYQPLTYDCLEEFHFQKIRQEYTGHRTFDNSYYMQTRFARFHR